VQFFDKRDIRFLYLQPLSTNVTCLMIPKLADTHVNVIWTQNVRKRRKHLLHERGFNIKRNVILLLLLLLILLLLLLLL